MNTTETSAAKHTMTEQEATDEALLLLVRKMLRLHADAFHDIWNRIPDGAKDALLATERRADRVRDAHGARNLQYPVADEPDDGY
jgi:hypothetical protein